MTSKSGVSQPRQAQSQTQPQRSNQRAPPHQALSANASARRQNEGVIDLTFDASETSANSSRNAPGARGASSRLKLELSKGSGSRSPNGASGTKSTPGTPVVGRPLVPPRGRPQLPFDVPMGSRGAYQGGRDVEGKDAVKPMPLPVRQRRHPPPPKGARPALPSSTKKDVRPKPYVLEVPAAAPTYPQNGHADFFPWGGHHPEDQFSENVIRNGYYDKAQVTQNELGSAKATIFPSLKHKSGLQCLSTLFTSVLAQRRAHGQITASSTFKPPPRVTVTDTKREMWLRDLANPTISLRRLSRSIPHGVKGKVLMDQSLSKNIPIERAVWLAKCVGANELRSFRRKGASGGAFAMGGEAKWIREFTVAAEHFVEGIVNSCGEGQDFRRRANYAVRLAAAFHAEHLFDREHYMDWLVSTVENSTQQKLPFWLLMVQIYWGDLMKTRKYGRRMATALQAQLFEAVNSLDADLVAPMIERLRLLLKKIVLSNPDNLVSPKNWAKYRDVMKPDISDDRLLAACAVIERRNLRLSSSGAKAQLGPRQHLIQLLDKSLLGSFSVDSLKKSWEVDSDKHMLVSTVLDWATSSYRPGTAKVYIGTRIIRIWARLGTDVTPVILAFLETAECESGRNRGAFYHLMSELARSKHFNVSTYVQWLIARGGVHAPTDLALDGPCATRLLAELPLYGLSDDFLRLRETLLRRAGCSPDDDQTRLCIFLASQELPGMQENDDIEAGFFINTTADARFSETVPVLTRTTKSEVAMWLRHLVNSHMIQPTLHEWQRVPTKKPISAITTTEFNIVRECLELIEEYSIFADVIKIVSSSNDAKVLASCADTVHLHLRIFAAIGALQNLFDTLLARLREIAEDQESILRNFLVSMSELAAKVPDGAVIAQQLSQDLHRLDRKGAADACSPVSDYMVGNLQGAEAEFIDEIEKVLSSGTSMDHGTMGRLFEQLLLRLEGSWQKSSDQQRTYGLLLTTLRTFGVAHFDNLMSKWLSERLRSEASPGIVQVCNPLIGYGCLSLKSFISTQFASQESSATFKSPMAGSAQAALTLLVEIPDVSDNMTKEEIYRLRISQDQFQEEEPALMLSVVRASLGARLSGGLTQSSTPADGRQKNPKMQSLLQRLVLGGVEAVRQQLVLPMLKEPTRRGTITSILDDLMAPGISQRTTLSVEDVIKLANDMTLPYCQLKLASILEEVAAGQLEAFDGAIDLAVSSGNIMWTCLVPFLDGAIATHLRQRAGGRFLALILKSAETTSGDRTAGDSVQQAKILLSIVDDTSFSISNDPSAPAAHSSPKELLAALNHTRDILAKSEPQPEQSKDLIAHWLPLLLSFTAMQQATFDAASQGKVLLALLAILLQLQVLPSNAAEVTRAAEQCFDLCAIVVDELPEEVRASVRRNGAVGGTKVMEYLFGGKGDGDEGWLWIEKGARGNGEKEMERTQFELKRWEMLGEPTPIVGENDTCLSLALFGARRS